MNQTLKDIYERKSVRVFEDRAIGKEEKRRILEAAIQAPTAGNQGMYAIIDVTDPELKAKLAETCDHQKFIATAPMVLAFCADYQRWYDAYLAHGETEVRKPAEGDLMLAFEDTLIAAQNAVVAAQSMGIGSCYIGDFLENYEIQKELLNLPKYVLPAVVVVFGLVAENPHAHISCVVDVNRFHPIDGSRVFVRGENKLEQLLGLFDHFPEIPVKRYFDVLA